MTAWIILAAVALQRISELVLARRNTAALLARGATESGAGHYPFIVAECNGLLSGYAYAGRLYERAAYRWVAEATVYVAQDRHRRGIGRALYRSLIASLREQGFQAVVGKITLPNPASVTLHESFGFVRSGVFTKVGFKHGKWHDVGLYQLDLGSRPTSPEETRPFA